ncbi:MAG: MoaD/ThiS family protein, partial [Rhodospirillales bacterium]|nr:MoaD/ThiS family protein [Rhodospirillales bacterium]
EASGPTVKTLLEDVSQKHPAIADRIFENGQVRRFVNIYLNDEDIRFLENLNTPVKSGDDLAIVPAIAGG